MPDIGFGSQILGVNRVLSAIAAKELIIDQGIYDQVLESATVIQEEASHKAPKRFGILRQNVRIAIATDVKGKMRKKATNRIDHRGTDRDIKKLKPNSVSLINDNLRQNKEGTIAFVYNVMPYAWQRDKGPNRTAPPGFMTKTAQKEARRIGNKMKFIIDKAARS
jgi:hypothetical protein